jgi:AcrR family transcriptional regulator
MNERSQANQEMVVPQSLPDRKSQNERSAKTRQLLLDAAIKCLSEHGYGMTTTTLVAGTAGVSRGAMLHQFPSKADLMIFVVEAIFELQAEYFQEHLRATSSERQRLLAYPEAVWATTRSPSGIAVLEIFQGSRSDRALADKLRPVQARIDATAIASLSKEFNRAPSIALFQLIVGAARGLALGEVIAPGDATGGEAILLLRELIEATGWPLGRKSDLSRAE